MSGGIPSSGKLFSPEHMAKFPEFYAARAAVEENRLSDHEIFWRDHNSWFKERGYVLRARYQPDWVASWKNTTGSTRKCEDKVFPPGGRVLDAIRTLDGLPVLFKQKQPPESDPAIEFREDHEIQIIQKFSAEPLVSDPKNHCVRLVEILDVPDIDTMKLMVIPLLFNWTYPRFTTIGEVVDFLAQIFEGLHFMHEHNVWHGDCKVNNIMMDAAPIQISSPHPFMPARTRDLSRKARYSTRTRNPVKYYWIDFDLSGEHDPMKGPPLTEPGYGGTPNVPEFAVENRMCDPFAVDVWCLGDMVRQMLTEGSPDNPKIRGLGFMDGLVADMTNEDPAKRPTMADVVGRFSRIKAGLSQWKLRSRYAEEGENILVGIFRSTAHWVHQARYVVGRVPAVPSLSPSDLS
ncbi:kinase-like domain-containing protein [Mycena vulgaris]|nr:kinase-like domain-containing protein [Mycena vulgaris]